MRKIYLSVFILLLSVAAFSQNYLGLVNNNYGGINSIMFNPAMGNKTLVCVQPFAFNANLYNNYLSFAGDFNIIKILPDVNKFINDTANLNVKNVQEKINGKDKYLTFTADVRGPAAMVGIGRFQVGYMWNRMRFGMQFSGVDEKLARNLWYIGRSPVIDVANLKFRDNRFAFNMNAWTESGISGAYAIKDDKHSMIRVGATVKSLNGIGAMYLKNGGTTFNFYRQPNSTSTDSILYAQYDLELGATNEFSYDPNPSNQLDTFTSSHMNFDQQLLINNIIKKQKRLGKGMGFDVGVVYEQRDGKKKSRYKYRAAVSLIDIGAVKYTNTNFTYVTKYKGENAITISEGLKGNNSRQYDTAIAHRFGASPGAFKAFSMALPTTLNVSFDYRLLPMVFINGTWIQSIRSQYTQGIRAFSSLSVTPRFESKWFSAALPIVLNDDYRKPNLGFCISLLNSIYVGSDNLGGAFGIGNISGFDFYAGAAININKPVKHKKKPKETELDTDKDGVLDKEDDCPKDAGLKTLKGCPDRDNDGLADKDDKCPDVAGPLNTQGCPDKDGDGFADNIDKCPDVAGKINGCPDTDKDGVADNEDKCPTIAGPIATKGCPDKDSDMVADIEDDCPAIAGLKSLKGCPDRDSDGVADKDDKCPDKRGTYEMKGCPDSDSDGVNDADDQCPLVSGTKENFGCPAKEKDVVKVEKVDLNADDKKALEEAFKNLEFESSKAELLAKSKENLDKVFEILQRNPTYRLLIVGHTDNSGNEAFNVQLSTNRAKSVKTYLVSKGIAADRFIVKGYGSSRPIADNSTPEGKQTNRRVEMSIVK